MRRLLTLAALTAALLLTMSGLALAADVAIDDSGLDPTRIVVDVREPIVWTNNTDEAVSLVGEEPAWESGPIEPGATFSIEITREGTYSYASEDGSIKGQIVVGEGGEAPEGSEDPSPEASPAPQDDPTEDDDENENGNRGDRGGNRQDRERDDEEALPLTGSNVVLPGVLSLLLMAFGVGLLLVTRPRRALRG